MAYPSKIQKLFWWRRLQVEGIPPSAQLPNPQLLVSCYCGFPYLGDITRT